MIDEAQPEQPTGGDPARSAPRPAANAGFLTSSLRVLEFTLGEMLWSRRTIFMGLVVGGPVVIAIGLRVLVSLDMPNVAGGVDGGPLEMSGPNDLRVDGVGRSISGSPCRSSACSTGRR